MSEFLPASAELQERRREEKIARARRRRDEFKPNFYVIADPKHRRHAMNISFRRPGPSKEKQSAAICQRDRYSSRPPNRQYAESSCGGARGGKPGQYRGEPGSSARGSAR
ncbi:hypothetical protein GCK32_022788 [Trichostrongylus colubriformis]|uniref:Uncharacterized protein n=1 Tax=Trichostrongylus colubriformis TaxID=6319 RepID=A0AAN8EV58_TRICO